MNIIKNDTTCLNKSTPIMLILLDIQDLDTLSNTYKLDFQFEYTWILILFYQEF